MGCSQSKSAAVVVEPAPETKAASAAVVEAAPATVSQQIGTKDKRAKSLNHHES
jgi:hypothetical protein